MGLPQEVPEATRSSLLRDIPREFRQQAPHLSMPELPHHPNELRIAWSPIMRKLLYIRQSRNSSKGDISSEFHPCWTTYYASTKALRYCVGLCHFTGECTEE